MDKLRRVLSGNDAQDEEESGIMAQVPKISLSPQYEKNNHPLFISDKRRKYLKLVDAA